MLNLAQKLQIGVTFEKEDLEKKPGIRFCGLIIKPSVQIKNSRLICTSFGNNIKNIESLVTFFFQHFNVQYKMGVVSKFTRKKFVFFTTLIKSPSNYKHRSL